MISLQFVREFVYENCTKVTTSKNGTHFHTRCPLCGDSKKSLSKKRFHLDYNNGEPIFQCFNCGRSGSFVSLYADLKGLDVEDANKEIFRYDPERIRSRLSKNGHGPVKIIKPPNTYHNYILEQSIGLSSKIYGIIETEYKKLLDDFIEKRKIEKPYSDNLRIATRGIYKGRIIIPIMEGSDILYFQGRAAINIEPKYLNPVAEKSSIILNKDNFNPEKYIIVTEGLLDAFSIGEQGTTCLGASITDDFLATLLTMTNKGVIVATDNDEAGKIAMWKIIKNSKYKNNIKYFVMPQLYIGKNRHDIKDMNELAKTFEDINIYDFILKHSYSKLRVVSLLKLEDKK